MIIIKPQDNKKSQLYFYCDNIFSIVIFLRNYLMQTLDKLDRHILNVLQQRCHDSVKRTVRESK